MNHILLWEVPKYNSGDSEYILVSAMTGRRQFQLMVGYLSYYFPEKKNVMKPNRHFNPYMHHDPV